MDKGACHGCGCEVPSDCCWYCQKCSGPDLRSRLIEMAIAELEQVPGGKLHNPRVLTAIGCLMSLRAELRGSAMPEPELRLSVPIATEHNGLHCSSRCTFFDNDTGRTGCTASREFLKEDPDSPIDVAIQDHFYFRTDHCKERAKPDVKQG